ncbi:MAG: amidohydrolase [Cytophagales bacterium]|nr:MAG: amidohydrolase [Cytophagales bacterium]
MKKIIGLLCVCLLVALSGKAQDKKAKTAIDKDKQFVIRAIEQKNLHYCQMARKIWGFAELGYLEHQSTTLLQETLQKEGFSIETGVADLPTAFVATYGSGTPVVGILAEFDALPGLSQDSVPVKQALISGGSGHGCGHNLFAAGSVGAAIALKDWLLQSKKAGTIKLFGTPAEEGGGGGKVYMVRAGLFDKVDMVLHWHPADANNASPESCLAYITGNFRFYGVSSHAAMSPDKGRSALDGVEAMNYMVNLMREHVPQETRMHYVITKGGLASNVVPDFAEVEYTVRHPDAKTTIEIWERIIKAAEGATLGTGTTMKYEVVAGLYNLLPNETVARMMYSNLEKIGGVNYTEKEQQFAEKLQKSLQGNIPAINTAQSILPYKLGYFPASTDVGDVSWVVPTAGLATATWVAGTPAHSWQAVAANGMSIGFKGMVNAAKIIAMTGVDIFNNPAVAGQAKAEMEKARGANFQYKSLVGNRKPPLEYRKPK